MAIGGLTRTEDGYAVVEAKIARSGMYDYAGFEMGRPDKAVLKIYRPEETVFSDASMATFAHKPITLDHPSVNVTADNYRELSRGITGGEVRRDGEYVVVPLMLTDAEAIAAVEGGKTGLSAGYRVEIDLTPGVTDSGEKYDGKMVGPIKGNHVAIVQNPRAGTFIGDSYAPQTKESPAVELKTVIYDGVPVQTTDAGAAVISKLEAQLGDAVALADAYKGEIADKDAELAQKDQAIEDLKAKQLDQSAIDKLADEKADVIQRARALVGDSLGETAGKSSADLRRAAVKHKLGDAAVEGKSDDYVAARFDAMIDSGANATRDAVSGLPVASGGSQVSDAEQKALEARNARLTRKEAK